MIIGFWPVTIQQIDEFGAAAHKQSTATAHVKVFGVELLFWFPLGFYKFR